MKPFVILLLSVIAPLASAKTLTSVAIAPKGAVIQTGTSLQFSVVCTYSDASSDTCSSAGGATWSVSRPSLMSVGASGLVTQTADSGSGSTLGSFVTVSVGPLSDRAGIYGQHPGDTFYQYMTPDYRYFTRQEDGNNTLLPMNVAVGATVQAGSGLVINNDASGGQPTGVPFQNSCSWSSSDTSKAIVSSIGAVTAIAPGTVTITCGRGGNGKYGTSSISGWQAPGNVVTFNVVNGGTSNQTWYVRAGGGTIFNDSTSTPAGQCDGKHDADYPGTGVNQPCAVGNLRYLWADGTSYDKMQWVISGGDTVIVRQNTNGYNVGLDQAFSTGWFPSNCAGDPHACMMPPPPSGTAVRHTRILGENYSACHADSPKTLLNVSFLSDAAFNLKDSQFVDVGCFEIRSKGACSGDGNFTNHCTTESNAGFHGILQSALTASVNYTDLFIHGLADDGIFGATGVGVVADHLHIRGVSVAGINMDDDPWWSGNISVAGGFTLTNSITEFAGCVEEYPVVHNYPYIECRDQNTGGYADGLGTASAAGDWVFDHDIWRYNFQDGLDLLHSGLRSLVITNSQSYGNDGQQFKIGSGTSVIFQNNISLHNCQRIGFLFGDEPASAIVPGVSLCRAAGDGIALAFDGAGTDIFQGNTYVGYGATSYDMMCDVNWDDCPATKSVFQNNINIGLTNPGYYGGQIPGLFYAENAGFPANGGWAVRDHNLYNGFRNGGCPTPLNAGELCADAGFIAEPPLVMTSEQSLDNYNFSLAANSPARAAGTYLANLTLDQTGLTRPTPPSMGSMDISGGTSVPPTKSQTAISLSATPSPAVAGQTVTMVASAAIVNGTVPTGTVSFSVNGTTVTSTLGSTGSSAISLPSLPAGTYPAVASYAGDANFASATSSSVLVAVNALPAPPPTPVPAPTPPPVPTSNVTISVGQPQAGFNVIPGSTRRIFATVVNGNTNGVAWSVKSGSAQISSNSGSWIDVTASPTGSSCTVQGKTVTSATQFIVEATSLDDQTKKTDVTFNVCKPAVQLSVVPSYRTLFANQTADVQSLIVGSVVDGVRWTIASQPTNGDGKLVDSTSRDAVFSATVPGRYTLSAASIADPNQTATSILYVTGHRMPYRVTRNMTEPVDCSVDPALRGTTYDVGPTQTYHALNNVPISLLLAGSTIRLHNEDTTGIKPTSYHEYVQLAGHGTADQPIRLCGVPDASGILPIVDAISAKGRSDVTAAAAGNGLITVGGSTTGAAWPAFNGAQNIIVEGLHLRNAKAGVAYTSPSGAAATWQSSAACLRIGDGHNISLVGNELDNCATGAASLWNGATWGGSSLDHLWEGNYIHASGTSGSSTNHQMSLQAWGQVIQFNRIDQMTAGATGANLKSRGVQDVIRYNYFGDGSARDMDLVDVQGAAQFMSFADFFQNNGSTSASTYPMDQLAAWQEAWNAHFAYGNIYLNSTSLAPIHFGYDQAAGETARKGNLYWYNNSFYQTLCASCSNQLWTMFDTSSGAGSYLPQTEFQSVQAFNNLVWMDSVTKPAFQWNNFDAFIGIGRSNLLPSGWGMDTLQGGTGDGWNATANSAAYQSAGSLSLHVNGFDGSNIQTASTNPFDHTSWILANATPGTTKLPSSVCEMPTRFDYLPTLGYAVPRGGTSNIGATDTASQTASVINVMGRTPTTVASRTCY